jgi:hypothetical protein
MTAMLENLSPNPRPFAFAEACQAARGLTSGSAAQASAILGILGLSQFVDIEVMDRLNEALGYAQVKS